MIKLARTIAIIAFGICRRLERRTTDRVERVLEESRDWLAAAVELISDASAIERWKRGEGRHPDD